MLHTVPSLAQEFDARAGTLMPLVKVVHVVDASLLASAVSRGMDDGLMERVLGHCRALQGMGSEAILVTCSSIGEAADAAHLALSIPVLRVDRPMAEEAARMSVAPGSSGRIAVVATLECTLAPSVALVASALGNHGDAEVIPVLCEGAADARAAGDEEGHDASVVSHVAEVGDVDVIVLAQASMAGAVKGAKTSSPVLTSPDGGMMSLAATLKSLHEDS